MMKRALVLAMCAAFGIQGAAAEESGGLSPMEQLGKLLFFDKISSPKSMSCADCHAPETGFSGPIPGLNAHGSVYQGAIPERFSNRRPQSASYATFSPIFHYDEEEELFIGGNFWDGRATGEILGNPASDQAMVPFLNPVEQNNPSKEAVLEIVAASDYAKLWEQVWGEPVSFETASDIEKNYGRVGLAIGAYEASREVNQFSSKFDAFWKRIKQAGLEAAEITMKNWERYLDFGLSREEVKGLALFNDEKKGKCALCHVLTSPEDAPDVPPLFTDFSYDNLGTPRNPENPYYTMDTVYLDDGTPINPEGESYIDPGLAGFLATRPEWREMAAENYGKHKVPSLRNADKRPYERFPKAFMHNGVFKSLKEVTHFYNTRDVEKWPPPEVSENVNDDELGDLRLTEAEEDAIVLFMQTLSDGYVPDGVGSNDGSSRGSAAPSAEPGAGLLSEPIAGKSREGAGAAAAPSRGSSGPGAVDEAALTRVGAARLARLPLQCLQREYPNKPGETLAGPTDIGSPRIMHPAFYGCFDWHSSVHGHWMLVKLLKLFPDIENGAEIRAVLAENLAAASIRVEVGYFQKAEEKSFERTYGWAWLLKLVEELHTFDDPLARELEDNLRPLADLIAARYLEFLPKLAYPIRVGEHTNTAFGLAFAWDYARAVGHRDLEDLIGQRARDFFLNDAGCPLGWEPSGFDFLSPCLEEADLMRRVLSGKEFAGWLEKFLPQLADKEFSIAPGIVLDRTDGKLIHLDGLNFSRAWCLYGIAEALPEYRHLRRIADEHMHRSLAGIADGSYEGEHWLASFAIHALSSSMESRR